MRPITTKAAWLEFQASNLHKINVMPSWPSEAAARADGYSGPVMIRSLDRDSPYMRPDIPMDDVALTIAHLVSLGANPLRLYLTHMTHRVGRRINAEVWLSPSGLYLNYSTLQADMRTSLNKESHHAVGGLATRILRETCDPDSADQLFQLLEDFSDHVIEFTAHDRWMGQIPGRNCVIWELRAY